MRSNTEMVNYGPVIPSCTFLKIYRNSNYTASADETVRVLPFKPADSTTKGSKIPGPLTHPVAVRAILPLSLTDLAEPYLITAAGDVLRTYDVSELDQPELLSEIDAHWHDITAIKLWMRRTTKGNGKIYVEPWIVTASLDRTIRKWKLSGLFKYIMPIHHLMLTVTFAELLKPPPPPPKSKVAPEVQSATKSHSELTEEEERELAELMEDD